MPTAPFSPAELPIVVFSHLRWSCGYRRPEHLLSRIASRHPVFFVEEPHHEPGCTPRLDRLVCDAPGVTLLQPVSDLIEPGFSQEQMKRLVPLVLALSEQQRWPGVIAWLYTPMAVPALARLRPTLVVYDSIDDIRAFADAPAELLMFERQLLRVADVVLTAGPGLHEAKRRLSRNAILLPSGFDAAHDAGEPAHGVGVTLAAALEDVRPSIQHRTGAVDAPSYWDSIAERARELIGQALHDRLYEAPDDLAGRLQCTSGPVLMDSRSSRSVGQGP